MSTVSRGRRRLGCALVATIASLSPAVSASPAAASVTIGQLAPGTPNICNNDHEFVQQTVTSGNSYVVPSTGTITSWSHNARAATNQELTMKIFRPLGGTSYRVVGHDGPHPLNEGALNTFPANISVKPGDVLGLYDRAGFPGCGFTASGDLALERTGNAADGDEPSFPFMDHNLRLNVAAVLVPANTFTLGATTRNKKKGTATLAVYVPNPGELSGSVNGANVASAGRAVVSKAVGPGNAQLLIKAKGKKKRKLNEKGKVKLNVAVTYTPTGGDPSTQSLKVKLKRKR